MSFKNLLMVRLIGTIFLVLFSDGVGLLFGKTSPMEILCDTFILAFMVGGVADVKNN